MNREQLDSVKESLKDKSLKALVDIEFCEFKGLICLGSTDEGYAPYSLEEYWSFAYAFVRGRKVGEAKAKQEIEAELLKCYQGCPEKVE